ncbi:MAG TPA: Crp/Fnr family transcriptional regulator [Candidatus Bathyarchaeia archaeon]|nr:Crp/Fnr family transcriptional regulator [Candidatus Bathyarchaeia archaeon]
MTSVGAQCNFLKASADLKAALEPVGTRERFSSSQLLFREEDNNSGVFLLLHGKVRMGVRGLPKLDRLFSAGALLGLPSTFTGHHYSLSAQALTDVDVIHVPQAEFLQLMRDRSELCRETTEMLGREVTFIQSALAERRKQAAKNKVSPIELGALM